MTTGVERVNNFYALVAAIWRPFGQFLMTTVCIVAAVLMWLAIASSVVLAIVLPIAGIVVFFIVLQCVATGVGCP